LARAHDTNPPVFLDPEQMWIASHHEGRTTFNGRDEVLVIIGIVTQAVERVLASNEISQDDNRLEPGGCIDLWTNVFPNLRVRERPEDFVDDGWRQYDVEYGIAQKPFENLPGRSFRTNRGADVHVGIKNGAEHRSFRLASGLPHAAPRPLLRFERQVCRLLVGEVASLLLIEKGNRLGASKPSHLFQAFNRNQSRQRLTLSFDDELVVAKRHAVQHVADPLSDVNR